MKNITLLFIIIPFFLCCQRKKEDNNFVGKNTDTMQKDDIKGVLEKQLKQGYKQVYINPAPDIEPSDITIGDLNSTVILVKELLNDAGFIPLSNQRFSEKVNVIFGRSIDFNSENKYLYINIFDKCDKNMNFNPNNYIDYLGLYAVKNDNFITEFYYIPELLDYKKSYPQLDIENTLNTLYKNEKGEEIKISLWKDKSNLAEQRKNNIQTIAARNMYLFNENKAQYKWLILNDQYFMESLVKTFGYTQDSELLKWVIENNKFDEKDPKNFGKLFWTKLCDGKFKLHADTFKVLQKLHIPNDPSENRFILDNIKSYLEFLGRDKSTDLTRIEKLKLMANLAYFAEQYNYDKKFSDDNKMMARLRYFLDDNDFEILKENNYFSLPQFKEWWDNADYDAYYVGECEYEGSCGSGYQPMDYTEWRQKHPKK